MTLQSILKQFNKTLTNLDALVKQNNNTVVKNEVEINQLLKDNTALIMEADKAKTISDNIRKLLGVK